jgi:hypothetical protein
MVGLGSQAMRDAAKEAAVLLAHPELAHTSTYLGDRAMKS